MLALPLRLAFASAVLLVLATSPLGQSANQKPDLPVVRVVVLSPLEMFSTRKAFPVGALLLTTESEQDEGGRYGESRRFLCRLSEANQA